MVIVAVLIDIWLRFLVFLDACLLNNLDYECNSYPGLLYFFRVTTVGV